MYAFSSCVHWHGGAGHIHDSHEFFFCLSPSLRLPGVAEDCLHHVEGVSSPTMSGDLFLLPAGQQHLCVCKHPSGCPCIVFNCTSDELHTAASGDNEAVAIFDALVAYAIPGHNRLPLAPDAAPLVQALLLDLVNEGAQKHPGWRCAQKQMLMRLLLIIYRNWGGGDRLDLRLPAGEPRERMTDVLRFVNLQYMSPIGVDDVLRVCCLSRSHFHAVFKEEVGQTFKEYLNTVRITRAREMLTDTTLPISQVALSCGFSSQSRFNTVFRAVVGYAPGAERHKLDCL